MVASSLLLALPAFVFRWTHGSLSPWQGVCVRYRWGLADLCGTGSNASLLLPSPSRRVDTTKGDSLIDPAGAFKIIRSGFETDLGLCRPDMFGCHSHGKPYGNVGRDIGQESIIAEAQS
jgi:hypothetical protein